MAADKLETVGRCSYDGENDELVVMDLEHTYLTGACWHREPVQLWDDGIKSWTVNATLRFAPPFIDNVLPDTLWYCDAAALFNCFSGPGMAFVIQTRGVDFVGGNDESLGYRDGEGDAGTFGIEFDSRDGSAEVNDLFVRFNGALLLAQDLGQEGISLRIERDQQTDLQLGVVFTADDTGAVDSKGSLIVEVTDEGGDKFTSDPVQVVWTSLGLMSNKEAYVGWTASGGFYVNNQRVLDFSMTREVSEETPSSTDDGNSLDIGQLALGGFVGIVLISTFFILGSSRSSSSGEEPVAAKVPMVSNLPSESAGILSGSKHSKSRKASKHSKGESRGRAQSSKSGKSSKGRRRSGSGGRSASQSISRSAPVSIGGTQVPEKQVKALKSFTRQLFSNNAAVLKAIIDASNTMEAESVARSLIMITSVTGSLQEVALVVVKHEVRSLGEGEDAFRGTSFASRFLSIAFNIHADAFRTNLLTPIVSEIMNDSFKLVESGPAAEAGRVYVQTFVERFSGALRSSSDDLPGVAVELLAIVHQAVTSKWGAKASRGILAQILFLRFLCPAFVTPQAFGVSHKKPNPQQHKILVHISKVITSAATGWQLTKAKNAFLEPLNEWILDEAVALLTFLDLLNLDRPLPGTASSRSPKKSSPSKKRGGDKSSRRKSNSMISAGSRGSTGSRASVGSRGSRASSGGRQRKKSRADRWAGTITRSQASDARYSMNAENLQESVSNLTVFMMKSEGTMSVPKESLQKALQSLSSAGAVVGKETSAASVAMNLNARANEYETLVTVDSF